MAIGLPVTTPGTEKPRCIETVSMIQAIVWAFVPTSGAGMSRVGADDPFELGGEPAGESLQLLRAQLARIEGDAALRPAERNVDEGALPGHPHGQGSDVVEVRGGVEPQPALGRARGRRCAARGSR